MKCQTIIDKSRDEEVMIYVHERTEFVEQIENFVLGNSAELVGYSDKEAVKISSGEIFCILVEDNKVYAITQNEKLKMKQRLYVLEEMLGSDFIKINQSCIVNIKEIKRFDASFAGALSVTLKNGYKDYISRRQLKKVKERICV